MDEKKKQKKKGVDMHVLISNYQTNLNQKVEALQKDFADSVPSATSVLKGLKLEEKEKVKVQLSLAVGGDQLGPETIQDTHLSCACVGVSRASVA